MNVLVYGAGPLGSLFAGRLQAGGHAVSLLARGQRLAQLREHGLVLEDSTTGQRTVTRVELVERLAPEAAYDLALVIMRKNKVAEVLPVLAANRRIPSVLFLMNNAAGPGEFIRALGAERVLVGFPMAGGLRAGHVIRYLAPSSGRIGLPFGEVDGRITTRTQQVAQVLDSLPGFRAEIRTDMDAWLKCHVALLMPSLVPALYAAETDNVRLAHTRDLVVLGLRAVREGFRVLRALGIPITPARLKQFEWIPEPLLVASLQRALAKEEMKVAAVGHALAAPDEMKHLADEFIALARTTPVPTPAINRLYAYFDPAMRPMPEGSATLRLKWFGR
jgi:2-dehydropantoate 2-reductase